MKRNQIILSGAIALVLLFIFIIPEYSKDGESKKLFDYSLDDISNLEYRGKTTYGKDQYVFAHYILNKKPNNLYQYKYEFNATVKELRAATPEELKFYYSDKPKLIDKARAVKFNPVDLEIKEFQVGIIVKSIFDDMRVMNYQYKFGLNEGGEKLSLKNYSLGNCYSSFTITALGTRHEFCVGAISANATQRYVYYKNEKKVLLIQSYMINRLEQKIHAYRNPNFIPIQRQHIVSYKLHLNPRLKKIYPYVFKKTGGTLEANTIDVKIPLKDKFRTEWRINNDRSISGTKARNIRNKILDFKGLRFSKDKIKIEKAPYLTAVFYTKKNFQSEAGWVKLWNIPHDNRFPLGSNEAETTMKDHPVVSSYQSGVVGVAQLSDLGRQLASLEKQIRSQVELEKKRAAHKKKQKQKLHMSRPGKKNKKK